MVGYGMGALEGPIGSHSGGSWATDERIGDERGRRVASPKGTKRHELKERPGRRKGLASGLSVVFCSVIAM